jgi:hypothetical protein
MVEPTKTDTDYLFQCDLVDLLSRLNEINEQGKIVVLLIDELNKMGVPLDADTSSFLTKNFLDKKGRYLIFSSHVQFHVDDPSGAAGTAHVLTSPSGRTMKTLPLPFCTDRSVLEDMLGGSSVTDLKITLSVGIPSLLFIMSRPTRKEMSFQQRFDDVVEHFLRTGRGSQREHEFVSAHRERDCYMIFSPRSSMVHAVEVSSKGSQRPSQRLSRRRLIKDSCASHCRTSPSSCSFCVRTMRPDCMSH